MASFVPSHDDDQLEQSASITKTKSELVRKLHAVKLDASKASCRIIADSASATQQRVHAVMQSHVFEIWLGFLITLNVAMVVIETDANAKQEPIPGIVRFLLDAIMMIYVIEICLRYYVSRALFWQSRWNLLDTAVNVSDLALMVAGFIVGGSLPSFSAVRVLRLARLVRVVRMMSRFHELQMLIHGITAAMSLVFWALVLLGVALALWSIVAVEFLHSTTKALEDEGAFDDCERCGRSFESVGSSMLTFVQNVIMGDSWRQLSIPLIERRPFAGALFLFVIGTINIGFLNLVIGVLVQTAQAARESIEKELRHEEWQKSRSELVTMFSQLDEDGSGELVREEILSGFDSNPAFRELCESVNLEREDIETVYDMLDSDDSGRLTMEEFVDGIHEMRHEQSSLLLMFIKYSVNEIRLRTREQCRLVEACIGDHVVQMEKSIRASMHGSDQNLRATHEGIDQAKKDTEQRHFEPDLRVERTDVQIEHTSQRHRNGQVQFKASDKSNGDFSAIEEVLEQSRQDVRQKPVRSKLGGEETVGNTWSAWHALSPKSHCTITSSRDPVYVNMRDASDTEPESPPLPVDHCATFEKQET